MSNNPMTPERLAELDALAKQLRQQNHHYLNAVEGEFTANVLRKAEYALDDLRAHLDAQAATIAGMREALNEAQGWFAEYAVLHLDKNTPEGVAKAASNARKAEYCAAALNATGAA